MKKIRMTALVVVCLVAACGRGEAPKPPEEMRTVRVLTVGERDSYRRFAYAGEIRARVETRLAFRVGGKLVDRAVQVGSRVRAGEVIARIDAGDLALGVNAARAQVAGIEAERTFAEADLKRYRELREKNFISQAEFDRRTQLLASTDARLDAARAQLGQSSNQAGYALLRADSDGVITGVEAEVGQVLGAGQTVARLARSGDIEIAFAVPEVQREAVRKAGEFRVSAAALPGQSWRGRLRELSPAADPLTRTYAARVTLVEAAPGLELGMTARVEAGGAEAVRAIELPLAALYTRGAAAQVFIVGEADTVRLQEVRLGAATAVGFLVESGLNKGERVVAAGAQMLRPGQRVRVMDGQAAAPAVDAGKR